LLLLNARFDLLGITKFSLSGRLTISVLDPSLIVILLIILSLLLLVLELRWIVPHLLLRILLLLHVLRI